MITYWIPLYDFYEKYCFNVLFWYAAHEYNGNENVEYTTHNTQELALLTTPAILTDYDITYLSP